MRAAASTEALKTLMTRALPVIRAVKVTKETDLGAILLSAAPDCLKMQTQIKGNGWIRYNCCYSCRLRWCCLRANRGARLQPLLAAAPARPVTYKVKSWNLAVVVRQQYSFTCWWSSPACYLRPLPTICQLHNWICYLLAHCKIVVCRQCAQKVKSCRGSPSVPLLAGWSRLSSLGLVWFPNPLTVGSILLFPSQMGTLSSLCLAQLPTIRPPSMAVFANYLPTRIIFLEWRCQAWSSRFPLPANYMLHARSAR